MKKKVLAKNCKINQLPKDWTAKANGTGDFIIEVPPSIAGLFGGTIKAPLININDFKGVSFDGQNPITLVGMPVGFDESGFH